LNFEFLQYLSIEIRFGQLREFQLSRAMGWVSSPISPHADGGLSSDIPLPIPIEKTFDHKNHRQSPTGENGDMIVNPILNCAVYLPTWSITAK
jgi:hypothetical protein